jgi:FKBP-type peptidyl-prolyl cis-trans isomerase FklB
MNMGKLIILGAGCCLALMQGSVRAENGAATNSAAAQMDKKEKLSYAIGMSVGGNLKRGSYDVDVDVLAAAIKDTIAGRTTKLTESEERETLMAYQREMQAKRQEEQHKLAEKNAQAADAFLAQNKTKAGVKTETATVPGPGNKTAEWQYKMITEGDGAMPGSNDMVTVNYRGTTIDGKEFDNSNKRPQAAKISPMRDYIRGRGEALQRMKAGSKWEIYLPASLAYGDRGGPGVEPGAAVIFEVELVSIDTPQPLTSDIIRVPSAEGLKKGEKVEVLKPEDVARMTKEGNTNGSAK